LVSTIIKDGVEWVLRELRKVGVSYEDARVLVTGGAGFLGSWVCDVLIQQNAKVTCLDNFSSGHPLNIEYLRNNDNFTFIEHDISQPINFDTKFDVVMHLASRASPFEFSKFPIQILKANTLGIWVALGIAKKHKATLLYASSSEIYGNPPPKYIPTPETYNGNVNPIGPRSCFSEDTEVLTRDGWKFFRDIKTEDEIMTISKEGILEYQKPIEIISEKYVGDMIKFQNTKIDLLVTPNHRMYVRERGSREFNLIPAFESIRWERAEMQKKGNWIGKEEKYFYLPPVLNNKVGNINKIKMDDWLEFLGYYITKGCVHVRKRGDKKYLANRYSVLIAQDRKDKERWNKIRACLERLPFRFYDSDDHQFRICNKQLALYLKRLGDSGERFIPTEFKNLSKRQLRILFDSLMLGDESGKCDAFYSSSHRLTGDMHELLLKLGISGNIAFKDKRKENPVYQIQILTDEKKDFLTPQYPRRTIERYDGLVYCVNVPNHVIFVRRNGKTLFCGNCYDEAKRCGEAFVVAYRLQHDLDTRIIRIFNSYGPRMRAGDIYGRVIPRFIDQALTNAPITVFGDGTQTRAFTYVTDMINGLLRAGLMLTARGQVINIGNNVETQIIQLAHLIKTLTESNSPIEFRALPIGDPERRCPDITKAQQLIQWQPNTSLKEGLKATIAWFKQTATHQ
jgi:UDP-glucuronate decarboxylase